MANSKKSFRNLKWSSFAFGNPETDWKIIFISAATLIVGVTLINAWMFFKVHQGEIFIAEEVIEEGNLTLDMEKLRETISYYQNKAAEFARIKRGGPQGADPSL